MTYAADYDRVLRYAHRTAREIQPHLDAVTPFHSLHPDHRDYEGFLDHHRDHFAVLSDRLQDEDDVRHRLVDRTLEEKNLVDHRYVHDQGGWAHVQHDGHSYQIGTVRHTPREERDPEDRKLPMPDPNRVVAMGWFPHRTLAESEKWGGYGFQGHFTPDEAREIVDRLPEPVAKPFRKHLDKMEGGDQNP